MVFSRIENFLAQNIEGFFNKKFASSLQLPELKKILERMILSKKRRETASDNHTKVIFIPDRYSIVMNTKDYENLSNPETIRELKQFLYILAAEKNYFMAEKPEIVLGKSPKIKLGNCEINACFAVDNPEECIPDSVATEVEQGTIIAPSHTFKSLNESLQQQSVQKLVFASIRILEGPDKDSYLEIGEEQIHLGRRDKNEFIITDPNVSRLHAFISMRKGRHIIMDANSLNGVYLNKRKVSQAYLQANDKIKIGNTVIIYQTK